jgi:hypothetical protein
MSNQSGGKLEEHQEGINSHYTSVSFDLITGASPVNKHVFVGPCGIKTQLIK